jgi:hypothetical protein
VVFLKVETPEKKPLLICEVKKLGFFDGICYPQNGSLRQTAVDHINEVDYDFEVTEVHRFDSALLNNWFPEWPPSTIVANTKTGEHITIPPSERQYKKVAKSFRSEEYGKKSSRWLPFRVFLMITGAVLIFISIYLKLKKQYGNKK